MDLGARDVQRGDQQRDRLGRDVAELRLERVQDGQHGALARELPGDDLARPLRVPLGRRVHDCPQMRVKSARIKRPRETARSVGNRDPRAFVRRMMPGGGHFRLLHRTIFSYCKDPQAKRGVATCNGRRKECRSGQP